MIPASRLALPTKTFHTRRDLLLQDYAQDLSETRFCLGYSPQEGLESSKAIQSCDFHNSENNVVVEAE